MNVNEFIEKHIRANVTDLLVEMDSRSSFSLVVFDFRTPCADCEGSGYENEFDLQYCWIRNL